MGAAAHLLRTVLRFAAPAICRYSDKTKRIPLASSLLWPGDMKRSIAILMLVATAACGMPPDFDRDEYHRYRHPSADPGGRDSEASRNGAPSGRLRIVAIDVGEGDATLVIAPQGEAALIDAGPPGAGQWIIRPFLESQGIEELQYAIATHYHADHIGGLPEVIAGADGTMGTDDDLIPRGGIYDRGEPQIAPESYAFELYQSHASGHRKDAHAGDIIELGEVRLEIVAESGNLADGTQIDLGDPPDENAASIAILIEYSGFRMFIGGDITGGGGTPPYETPDVETPLGPLAGDIDVLRAAHHGSDTSTNQSFLDEATPEAAIISVGDDNDYFHPHPSVIGRLLDAGIDVYQTERGSLGIEGPAIANGDVTIWVEGDGSYQIELPQ